MLHRVVQAGAERKVTGPIIRRAVVLRRRTEVGEVVVGKNLVDLNVVNLNVVNLNVVNLRKKLVEDLNEYY